jgi:hypothetical protein
VSEVEKLWREWERLRDSYYAGAYSPEMKRLVELASARARATGETNG